MRLALSMPCANLNFAPECEWDKRNHRPARIPHIRRIEIVLMKLGFSIELLDCCKKSIAHQYNFHIRIMRRIIKAERERESEIEEQNILQENMFHSSIALTAPLAKLFTFSILLFPGIANLPKNLSRGRWCASVFITFCFRHLWLNDM